MQSQAVVEPTVVTPDRRLRVFISSTLHELGEERRAIRRAVERMHLTPVMFELGARPHAPRSLYRAYLQQSDVFVGVYGARYGWVAPGESVSGLEDEYDLSAGMPRLLYVLRRTDDRDAELTALLRRIEQDDTASYRLFDTAEELAALVVDDLAVLLTERFTGSNAAPGATSSRHRHNLPAEISSFVGRELESAQLIEAIRRSRLVTLTGVGGSGKTRLALHVAHELVDEFAGGVWLAELGAVTQAEGIATALLAALNVRQQPARTATETAVDAIGDTAALIILDNCEHLLTASGQFALDILKHCAGARVLATSREGLGVAGETIVALPSLPVPPATGPVSAAAVADVPSVRLFIERARAVRPDFALTDAEVPALMRLIRRLDGIPLAVELAAARIRALTISQIEERLDDRFRLLAGGSALVPRQQTLAATMDWSYDLLERDEQTLLRRLSVFTGDFDLDAAEDVCPLDDLPSTDVLDLLTRLVGKSLVAVVPNQAENRYRLLETIRQYTQARLNDADELLALRNAHRDHFLRLVESAGAGGDGASSTDRMTRLSADLPNLHAALEWSDASGDAQTVLRMAVAMAWFWYVCGHWSQGRQWFARIQDAPDSGTALRARSRAWAAVFAWRRGDTATAVATADACLKALDDAADGETRGLCLLVRGVAAMTALQDVDAERDCRAALEAFENVGNTWGSATALLVLAQLALGRRDPEANELLSRADRLLSETRDAWARGVLTTLLAYQAFLDGDLHSAERLYRDSAALTRHAGDRSWEGQALLALGHIDLLGGRIDRAREELGEARRIIEALQDRHEGAHLDEAAALLAVEDGDVEGALRILHRAEGEAQHLGHGGGMGAQALGLAAVYRDHGRVPQAAALAHHALALLQHHGERARVSAAMEFIQDLATAYGHPAHVTDVTTALAVAQALMGAERD